MTLKLTRARLEKLSRLAAIGGGLGMLLVSVMITIDVILRKFFDTTLGGANEIAGYVFAASTALAYPYVLFDKANIRIDAIYTHLSSKVRAFLDVFALIFLTVFVAVLTKFIVLILAKSWEANSMTIGVINIPLWIPQLFWVFGYVLFFFTACFLTGYAMFELLRHRWNAVNQIGGIPSLESTIEEETHIHVETKKNEANLKYSEGAL